ncbi:hypothetical protein C0995_005979 [Termitomyces sp. Mi166|nr:hypothetical protein C0995_005979 [Termitomyces sp. Mi166\
MGFRGVLLGLSFVSASLAAVHSGFNYGSDKVRGVNLGGWLVIEPWITPSLFDNTGDSRIIDEYTFGKYQDHAKAYRTLKAHWDSWITEADFRAIAGAGLNHVRLPIGYWAFDVSGGEPYVQGQLPYLDKAVSWAEKHGIKVIIDLHGAPGSQNGFDNSGLKTSDPQKLRSWYRSRSNIDRTNAIIKRIANTYKDRSNVVSAIAALNDYPYGNSKQSNTQLMISDAFQGLDYWRGFMRPPKYEGVIMDIHKYQMFSPAVGANIEVLGSFPLTISSSYLQEVRRSNSEHIAVACAQGPELANFSPSNLYTIVGEWTPAATDCAKYLNGRGVGSRYDGTYPGSTRVGSCTGLTGKASTFSSEYKTFLRQYWEAQTKAFERGNGWIQWTWKAEFADEWSYQAGLANGWIPQSPTSRAYPNICG